MNLQQVSRLFVSVVLFAACVVLALLAQAQSGGGGRPRPQQMPHRMGLLQRRQRSRKCLPLAAGMVRRRRREWRGLGLGERLYGAGRRNGLLSPLVIPRFRIIGFVNASRRTAQQVLHRMGFLQRGHRSRECLFLAAGLVQRG